MQITAAEKEKRKIRIMETCFDCYCEKGLNNTGIDALGKACGMNKSSFYNYFDSLDELIIQSTAYCMQKVEDEFMAMAPTKIEDVPRFFEEMPYYSAKHHGMKYRLMYQVYSSPKYYEYGQAFFDGVNKRYAAYAAVLETRLGVPRDLILSVEFMFVRAVVHYAMFLDEYYLKVQMALLSKVYQQIKNGTYNDKATPADNMNT